MSITAGPDTVENGLVLSYDAGNLSSLTSANRNFITHPNYNPITWASIFPANTTLTTGIDAPDGTNTAVRVTCKLTGSTLIRIALNTFIPNGVDAYTVSFYVRKISGTITPVDLQLWCDLQDLTPSGNYLSNLITNQWVRVSFTAVPTAAAKTFFDILSDVTTDHVLDFWGAQIEAGPTATDVLTEEQKATVWKDSANKDINLALTNSPRYSPYGPSMLFYAGSKAVALTEINFEPNTTWEAWVRRTSSANAYNMFMGRNRPYFGIRSSNVVIFSTSINGSQRTVQSVALTAPDAVWYHLAFTIEFDGVNTTMKMYINGVESGTGVYPGTQDNAAFTGIKFTVGDGQDSLYYPFSGNVSQVKIYNRTLSQAEITQNFKAMRSRYGI